MPDGCRACAGNQDDVDLGSLGQRCECGWHIGEKAMARMRAMAGTILITQVVAGLFGPNNDTHGVAPGSKD